jgi:hypothetical protein
MLLNGQASSGAAASSNPQERFWPVAQHYLEVVIY